MKIRMLALAGAAAVALSAPAHAATEGWYLGLGGGYDEMSSVNARSAPFPSNVVRMSSSDSGIGVLSFGYSWMGGFRIENEIGYTSHDANTAGFGGSSSVTSDMVNFVYDIPLGDQWKLSLGGGVGAGNARIHWTTG
ncbi:MAG: outer membrane beta-barrel protein, partial [Rhizomicrobium sp.]